MPRRPPPAPTPQLLVTATVMPQPAGAPASANASIPVTIAGCPRRRALARRLLAAAAPLHLAPLRLPRLWRAA
jgi:hypothetical protein